MGAAGTARLTGTGLANTTGLVTAAGPVNAAEITRKAGVRPDPGPRAEVVVLRPRSPVPARPGAGRVPAGPGLTVGRRNAPIRLTKRGRIVVAALALILAAGIAVLAWLALAGGAQALGRGQSGPGSYRKDLTRVVVQPGQTLWSIAVRAEPSADPRLVIQQILDINSLSGAGIQAGQVLWVPRG